MKNTKGNTVTELQTKAVAYLKQFGLEVGVDFTEADAMQKAQERAEHMALEENRRKVEAGDEWYEFGGNDSCEDCAGWNGVDNRCNCGNRRVYWTTYGRFDEVISVYAQAD